MNVVKNTDWKVLPKPLKNSNFKSLATAMVDGELWHTVQCKKEVSIWLRSQPGEDKLWFQNIDEKWMMNFNTFDVHPTVFTVLALRWS